MVTIRRIFVVTAIACGASWLLKSAVYATFGGAATLPVGVLWFTGMGSFILAAGAGTVLLLHRAPVWVRAVGGVVALLVAFPLQDLLHVAVKAVYPLQGWFRDELALVLIGVVLIVGGLRVAADARRRALG